MCALIIHGDRINPSITNTFEYQQVLYLFVFAILLWVLVLSQELSSCAVHFGFPHPKHLTKVNELRNEIQHLIHTREDLEFQP